MIAQKEVELSSFVRKLTKSRIHSLPHSYSSEDVAQEVMLALWKKFGEGWIDVTHNTQCYGFVLKSAKRRAADFTRKACGSKRVGRKRLGPQASFCHLCDEPYVQPHFISPEFYAELVGLAESSSDINRADTRERNDSICNMGISSRLTDIKIAKKHNVSACYVSRLNKRAREHVLGGLS